MEQFKIQELFACPIFFKDLNLNNKVLEKYALQLKRKDKGRRKSNVGGYQTNDLPYETEEILQPLCNELLKNLEYYKEFVGFKMSLKKKLDNMWININGNKDYHTSHIHPACIFSGVYYINAPLNSGNIVFEHSAFMQMQYDWKDEYKHIYNEVNSDNFFMPAITGRLYIFPSWLRHSVSPNLTNKNRIALSFNSHFQR